MNEGSVRETKFQWKSNFCRLLRTGMQRMQQGPCRMMAAENREGFGVVVRAFAYEGAFRWGEVIDDCDAIAEAGEAVGGSETGRASS